MKQFIIALFVAVLGCAAQAAFAHRLDEYLQSTTIGVAHDHVSVVMRLTPGVAVLPALLSTLDANGDGTISAAEQRAYEARLLGDVELSLDGRPLKLATASSSYPGVAQIKEGLGEIVYKFFAPASISTEKHVITFANRHLPKISVYLANCLVPDDPAIAIGAQTRSFDQSSYQIAFRITPPITAAPSSLAPTEETAFPKATVSRSVLAGYFIHGIRHILTGYDHLLFVAALVLAAGTFWELVKVVSTFTLAHTITLTLAAFNVVHVSPHIVEPLIAASIVVVALQNVCWPRRAKGWSRLAAVFFFGLFHGLGFAGGLLDAMREMPGASLLLPIFAFSLGVEFGHQMVVLPLYGAIKSIRAQVRRREAAWPPAFSVKRMSSAAISLAGIYYLCLALTQP